MIIFTPSLPFNLTRSRFPPSGLAFGVGWPDQTSTRAGFDLFPSVLPFHSSSHSSHQDQFDWQLELIQSQLILTSSCHNYLIIVSVIFNSKSTYTSACTVPLLFLIFNFHPDCLSASTCLSLLPAIFPHLIIIHVNTSPLPPAVLYSVLCCATFSFVSFHSISFLFFSQSTLLPCLQFLSFVSYIRRRRKVSRELNRSNWQVDSKSKQASWRADKQASKKFRRCSQG